MNSPSEQQGDYLGRAQNKLIRLLGYTVALLIGEGLIALFLAFTEFAIPGSASILAVTMAGLLVASAVLFWCILFLMLLRITRHAWRDYTVVEWCVGIGVMASVVWIFYTIAKGL